MDIISHTLTGVAVGTVFATLSKGSWKKKGLIILAGGFGGALPDFDAISLWSKFDSTIGTTLGLKHTGKEIYFGKFWYSHHAALHSILAPSILILLWVFFNAFRKKSLNKSQVLDQLKIRKFSLLAFFFGFVFHLLEDMPTPSSVWSGVNLFFPSPGYIGGTGDIWWWNNYDLFLIITSVIVINLLINTIPKHYNKIKSKACIAVFALGVSLFVFQIKTRPIDFSYSGHTTNYDQYEAQSKQIQKDILGNRLYRIMTAMDDRIPLYF